MTICCRMQVNMYCSLIDIKRTYGYGQKFSVHRKQSLNHIPVVHKSCTTTYCITIDRGIRLRHSKCPFLTVSCFARILISHINNHKNSYQIITTISTMKFSTVVYMLTVPLHNLNKLRHYSFWLPVGPFI